MKIAIDVSPIEDSSKLAHRVRGTGFYISHLKEALLRYYPHNTYIFFSNTSELSGAIDIAHYPYFEPFFLTLPFFSKYNKIVTVHDLIPLVFPKQFPVGIKGSMKWLIQKNALRKANIVITDSFSSKRDIAKYAGIPEAKIEVIYLAAGEEFKRIRNPESKIQNLKKKYNLPDKFVLYVGDVTWNKNLPRFVRAIKQINIPLVMVGKALVDKDFDKNSAWNRDLIEVTELIKNDDNIIRLGFVANEELITLYNQATVFAMPSLYEGFGLPILEAMSCGCPVLTSRSGSIPEVGGDAVYYVNGYDMNSISDGIRKMFFDERLRNELSKKGLDRAKEFNWKKSVDNLIRVYKKLI